LSHHNLKQSVMVKITKNDLFGSRNEFNFTFEREINGVSVAIDTHDQGFDDYNVQVFICDSVCNTFTKEFDGTLAIPQALKYVNNVLNKLITA
jgi:hypothetical protein